MEASDFDEIEPFGLHPSRLPEEARSVGRYVLENDEHVDVLVARSQAVDGAVVEFEALWATRRSLSLTGHVSIAIPDIAGLILTKRIAARPKDLEDIRLLEALRTEGE